MSLQGKSLYVQLLLSLVHRRHPLLWTLSLPLPQGHVVRPLLQRVRMWSHCQPHWALLMPPTANEEGTSVTDKPLLTPLTCLNVSGFWYNCPYRGRHRARLPSLMITRQAFPASFASLLPPRPCQQLLLLLWLLWVTCIFQALPLPTPRLPA